MKDKHMSAKRKKSNWSKGNKNRNKNKINHFVPTQEQRVDPELLQEVSVFLSVNPNIDDRVICNHYKITERQLQYIKKHQQKWDVLDKITRKELK